MEEIIENTKVWCPKEFGNDEQGDFALVQMLTEDKDTNYLTGVFLTESLSFANSPKIGDVVTVDTSGAGKESGAAEGLPVITGKKDIGLSSFEVREMERNKDFSPVLRKLGKAEPSQVSVDEEIEPEGEEEKIAMKKQAFVSKVPGHKNSKGELAEWCIKSHKNNKILQSFTSEENAKKGLKSMEYHKHKASKVKQGDLLGDLMAPISGASPELIEGLKHNIEMLEQYLGDIQTGVDQTANVQFHLDAMKELFKKDREKKENEGEERQSKLSDKEKSTSLEIEGEALLNRDWKNHSKEFVKEKLPNQDLTIQGKSILDFDYYELKKQLPEIAKDFCDWDFYNVRENLTDGLLGAGREVRDESAQYAKGVLAWNDLSKEAKQYLKEELK